MHESLSKSHVTEPAPFLSLWSRNVTRVMFLEFSILARATSVKPQFAHGERRDVGDASNRRFKTSTSST